MKKNAFKLASISLATSLAIGLTACGGGSDSDDKGEQVTPVEETGKFIDAAVANLDVYQNGEKVDTTDSDGVFTYTPGSEVTFKLGNLILGSTMPKAIITPADLSPLTEDVIEILQVLQSLDEDNNPDNGIYIPQTTIDKLVTALDLSDEEVKIADTVAKDIPELVLVARDKVIEHFNESQAEFEQSSKYSNAADRLAGYWYLSSCDEGQKSIFEFEKVSDNSVQIIGGLVNTYNDNSCTGSPISTESYVPDDDEIKWSVVGTPNENTVNVIFENDDDGQQTIPPYLAPIEFDGEKITITSTPTNEIYSLIKLDSLEFPGESNEDPELEATKNKLVGYWKSTCNVYSDGSKIYYINLTKQEDGSIIASQSLRESFDTNDCTGNSEITTNETQGYTIPDSDIIAANFNGNNQFTTTGDMPETYNRILESAFPIVTQVNPIETVEDAVNTLVGYWKSECKTSSSGDKSRRYFINFEKESASKLKIISNIEERFDSSANCTGQSNKFDNGSNEIIDLNEEGLPEFNGTDNFVIDDEYDGREEYNRINQNEFPVGEYQ